MDLGGSIWIANEKLFLTSTSGAGIIERWHIYSVSKQSTSDLKLPTEM